MSLEVVQRGFDGYGGNFRLINLRVTYHVTYIFITGGATWHPRGSHVSLWKPSSGGVDQAYVATWHILPRQHPSTTHTPSPRSDLGPVPVPPPDPT